MLIKKSDTDEFSRHNVLLSMHVKSLLNIKILTVSVRL